jgi:tetratricopeptide (TPR) repeat protein
VSEADVALAREDLEMTLRILGEKHINTVYSLSNLGWIYTKLGRYDEALEPMLKSVELCGEIIDETHPASLYMRNRLVSLYHGRGQDKEADDLLMRIVADCQREHGKQYPHTWRYKSQLVLRAQDLRALGAQQYQTGRYPEALATFSHLAEVQGVLQEEMLSDVALPAMSLHRLGRDREAQDALRRLRQMSEQGDPTQDEHDLYEAERSFAPEGSQEWKVWDLMAKGQLDEARAMVARWQTPPQQDTSPLAESLHSMARALSHAYCRRGSQAERRGDFPAAIRDYEGVLQSDPAFAFAHDRLARLLATCQSAPIRDGVRAIDHGTRSCELTEWKNPSFLSTLAAACAEGGDFRRAVQYQKRAIDLLREKDPETSPVEHESRLGLYESRRPYHRSLVAQWDFEQSRGKTVSDSSGNGLNGRLMGDARIIHDADRPGKVLHLDGKGDWVDCGADPGFNVVSEITLTCWVKTQKFDQPFQTIVSRGDNAWRLARERATATLHFACSGLAVPKDVYGAVRGKVDVNDGRWHHLAGTYDGTAIRLYVDGKLDATTEASGSINVNTFRVLIGENDKTRREGQDRAFEGLLDDVRIHNYALSEAEIEALVAGKGAESAAP